MTIKTTIIQRVIPHYRVRLFERLYEEFGWIVATSAEPPAGTSMKFKTDLPFVKTFPFRFPDPKRFQRCIVPVRQILNETGADVVITEPGFAMTSTWELAFRRKMLGYPKLLFWGHGFNADIGIFTQAQRARQMKALPLFASADACIMYGDSGRKFLQDYLPKKKFFVAHNTLDVAPARSLAKEVTPADLGPGPNLLSVGRLTRPKRFEELIDVFKTFRQRFPTATLTLIGDGPDAAALRQHAGGENADGIVFKGAIYDERELARYFVAADAFVTCGAVGLSVNHALAYGLPVICYDHGLGGPKHRPEIAYVMDGVSGKLIRPFTQDAMVEGLADFFATTPRPREHFADSIAELVHKRIDLESMVADFRDVNLYVKGLFP